MQAKCAFGLVAVGVLLALAGSTASASMVTLDQWPGDDVSSLVLADGTWDLGQDWFYNVEGTSAFAVMNEQWIHAGAVDIFTDVDTEAASPTITINKNVENDTDFVWTDFHIQLIPQTGTGPIVVDPASASSANFSDVVVANNPDGSATIDWFLNRRLGDVPVQIGEFAKFDFTFEIFGDTRFKMIQVPTPEASTCGLVALGCLGLLRRPRR